MVYYNTIANELMTIFPRDDFERLPKILLIYPLMIMFNLPDSKVSEIFLIQLYFKKSVSII